MIHFFNLLKVKPELPQQIVSKSWEERTSILDNNTNLFCWKRESNESIHQYLEYLSQQDPKPIRSCIEIDDLASQIKEISTYWDTTQTNAAQELWQDIHTLARDFLLLSNVKQGTLHLRVIHDDACTKFHTDGYHLRLFTTYYGKGTEWLPENAVNRKALGKSNNLIVLTLGTLQT